MLMRGSEPYITSGRVIMRYSIIGATPDQVESIGGIDVKEAHSTGIIFATLTEEQVTQLKAMDCQVELVSKVSIVVMPPAPVAAIPTYTPEQLASLVGIEQVRSLVRPPLYGEGLTLAVVDTGIRETHEKVSGRVVYSKNYTSDPMRDGFDHGTGACSIALAMAPQCNILNLKVLNDKGEGTEEEVVLAIDDCIDLHDTKSDIAPTAINLSLGSPDDGNPNNIIRVACRAATDRGIWVIAAAGNSGPAPGTIMSPACERYVLAMGSGKYLPDQKSFVVSDFSSRGPTLEGLTKPDCIMFGEDITMASSASDTATVAKSGTSFATPFGSGMAILLIEGVYKAAVLTGTVPGLSIESVSPLLSKILPIPDVFNIYLGKVCIKPAGVVLEKDNDYGYGLAFGPLAVRALSFAPAVDISSLLGMMIPIMVLSIMMPIMIKAAE